MFYGIYKCIVIGLVSCLMGLPYTWAQNADNTLSVNQIEIIRDSLGIPHIYAPTDAGVAYGLAWAQAEDQFPKLQSILLMTRTRGGEVIGIPGAVVDFYVHFIRARQLVNERYYTTLSADYRALVEAYAAGLTAYARTHPEQLVLRDLLPFTGQDIVTGYVITLSMFVGAPSALQYLFAGKPNEYIFGGSIGSNAYAFSKKITKENETMLCINPHIPLRGPVSWYEAQLCSGQGLNIYGGFFPGMPTPGLGTTPNLAWGMTFNWPDFVDIYQLKINPQNKKQYIVDGKPYNFEYYHAKLKGKLSGGKKSRIALYKDWWKVSEIKSCMPKVSLRWKFRSSIYGPVWKNRKGYFALRVATEKMLPAPEQWYRMAKAQNFSTFHQALQMQAIPLFNIVYADKYDTLYYCFNATLPHRSPNYNWQKVLPGDTSATLWQEYLSLDELPQILNPRCGYIYNTNCTPFHATCDAENLDSLLYPTTQGLHWNRANNRDLRFRELIAKTEFPINYAQFKAFKYDAQYPANGGFVRTHSAFTRLEIGKYPAIADAILSMRYWNKSGTVENRQAALALTAHYYLERALKMDLAATEVGTANVPEKIAAKCLKQAKRFLIKHYGSIHVPLGKFQIHERGKKEVPVAGMPDAILAAQGVLKKGKMRLRFGDTFLQFVRFTDKGVQIEGSMPFGASDNPDSKHYTDQMDAYSQQRTRQMLLDISQIRQKGYKTYHPY